MVVPEGFLRLARDRVREACLYLIGVAFAFGGCLCWTLLYDEPGALKLCLGLGEQFKNAGAREIFTRGRVGLFTLGSLQDYELASIEIKSLRQN